MNENLKYFNLLGLNTDTNDKKIVIACKPEEVDFTKKTYESMGYALEECECPKNATMISSHIEPPTIPDIDIYDPFSKSEIYNGPCCGRCANRFKKSDFCTNHCQSNNCYRFKLEK